MKWIKNSEYIPYVYQYIGTKQEPQLPKINESTGEINWE
jgi:hypothetical protein